MNNILIVVDMQNDFVDGALGTPEALAIVPHVCAKIRAFQGNIFVTMDTHDAGYLQTREGRFLPVAHCIKGTPGWALNTDVAHALEDKSAAIVEKPTFGAVDLPQRIAAIGTPDSIELIGLCTDICVVSNALLLKAHFPQTDILVDAACCAGVTPQAHKSALDTMQSCQIEVLHP